MRRGVVLGIVLGVVAVAVLVVGGTWWLIARDDGSEAAEQSGGGTFGLDNGAAKFAQVTTELTEAGSGGSDARQLALVVDTDVVSAPQVVEPITGGKIDIQGKFTKADAEGLVERITG